MVDESPDAMPSPKRASLRKSVANKLTVSWNRIVRLLKSPKIPKSAKLVVGIITFVGVVLGIVVTLFPTWQPPWSSNEGSYHASLSHVTVGENATLREFCDARVHRELRNCTDLASRGSDPGVVVSYNVEVEGLKGEKLLFGWSLLDSNRDVIVGPDPNQHIAWPDGILEVDRDANHEEAGEAWIPVPYGPGTYYVEITVTGRDRTYHQQMSQSFTVEEVVVD